MHGRPFWGCYQGGELRDRLLVGAVVHPLRARACVGLMLASGLLVPRRRLCRSLASLVPACSGHCWGGPTPLTVGAAAPPFGAVGGDECAHAVTARRSWMPTHSTGTSMRTLPSSVFYSSCPSGCGVRGMCGCGGSAIRAAVVVDLCFYIVRLLALVLSSSPADLALAASLLHPVRRVVFGETVVKIRPSHM